MTTPTVTSLIDSQMHNNIMAADSRDRPPMLTTGRYPQWRSRKQAYFKAEKEAIHLILTGIGDEIYSTVDVCQTAQEIWEAIERLQQGESLNIQDVKTNLFWKFGKSTSHDGETMESYYTIFYKLMNEMIRNNLTVATIYKGKEIAKPITPPSETAFKEDIDPEQAQRDKDMQKNLALIAKYFKKIYKPTNNNLRTSSNSRNKNVDTTSQYKNDSQSGQFGNQRTVNVAGQGKKKPKRVKDSAYHKEKMLMCKQAEQADSGTDSKPVEQVQNDDGYNVFSNDLQHSEQYKSVSNTCLVETDDSNVIPDSPDMCEDDIQNNQNDVESDDERVVLANLIANLKLNTKHAEFEKYKAFNDRTVNYDKLERKLNETLGQLAQKDIEIKEGLRTKAYEISVAKEKHNELIKQSILTKSHYEGLVKQKTKTCLMPLATKIQNDSFRFVHELKQEMHADLKYVESLEKEIDKLESDKAEFSDMYDVILQECVKNDTVCNEKASNIFRKEREQYFKIQDLKAKLQDKNIAISELKKLIEKGKGKSVDTKFDKPSVVRQPNAQRIPKPSILGKPAPFSNSLERIYFPKTTLVPKTNVLEGLSKPVTAQTLPQTARQAVCNTNVLKLGMYRIENRSTQTRAPQLPQTVRNTNLRVSTSTGVTHKTNVSRPQHKSNQLKDKVLPNNSQVKCKKTQVEVHPRIPSVSNKMKYVTACKDILNSRTLNANAVCATCNKCLVDSNHFACVTKMLNDVNARTKKPTVVPISTRKPKSQTNKSVATHHKKKVASKSTSQKPHSYFRMLLSHLNFDYINFLSKNDVVIGVPNLKYIKDQLCSSCKLSKAKRSSFKSKVVLSSKGRLNLLHMDLCGPMRVASINGKKYILVIVDDYSRYTWTLFLHSKDETPEVLKDFLTMIQRNLQALVIAVRADRGIEFLNKTLDAFFKEEGIKHQTSTARIPERNDVVERQNRTLVEAARMMLSASKLPLFFWAEAIATRTRMIVESIHIRFDEFKEVSETSVANNTSGLVPQRQKASDYDNPDPVPQRQDVSSSADADVTSQQELDLVFGPLYDEFFNAGEQSQDDEFTNPFCAPTQDEAESSSHNIVWELIDKPFGKSIIRLKWLWKNKKDEDQTVIHNKARLVAKGTQVFSNLSDGRENKISQLSTKGGGLCCTTRRVCDPDHPEKVYRLRKALYRLKQAPRAWYDELSKFLTSKGFTKGLQIPQSLRGIFINQTKYTLEILHKHGMEKGHSIGTPMATKPKVDADLSGNPVDKTDYRSKIGSLMYLTSSRPDIVATVNMGLWYPKGSSFELTAFSDVDHVECIDSHKSTYEGIQFLGDKLVSWMSKKQNCTAMSSAEDEYMALSASCAQIMWMKTQL
nr:retrovirus-related Pol polyprotein from transposon TNT 1-94 [Tanacetum cinerariifolium]